MKRIEWEMDKGRTLAWLAEELGISRSQLSRIMKGERRWTEENLEKAARALGVLPEDLLVEVEPCAVCEGYGTVMVREGGQKFVMLCDECDGGCVPVVTEPTSAIEDGVVRVEIGD